MRRNHDPVLGLDRRRECSSRHRQNGEQRNARGRAPLRRSAGEREGPAPRTREGEVVAYCRLRCGGAHPPHPALSPRERVEREIFFAQ
jgi:hypothetical protein